ncbi:type II toxin-antitoxin system VapC family toxin [Halomarina pelagica]|uniref:type II toxin-antitoxin system VapC family toxin n=1 Tax=Halomarina pelagica TaxID=2961599 RepID=UPI0020C310E2|nr:PIN domain-containing protein [Halomarina sp. BND7]
MRRGRERNDRGQYVGTFTAAWEAFRRYDDQRISFVDATSAVLAREAGIRYVFGYDSDFATLGFTRVPATRR